MKIKYVYMITVYPDIRDRPRGSISLTFNRLPTAHEVIKAIKDERKDLEKSFPGLFFSKNDEELIKAINNGLLKYGLPRIDNPKFARATLFWNRKKPARTVVNRIEVRQLS